MKLDVKLSKKTCKQWYELQDQDSRQENVITLATRKNKERMQVIKSMLYLNIHTTSLLDRAKRRCKVSLIWNMFHTLSVSVSGLQDHVRYLYYEHQCDNGKPQTVKRCLFYKTEGRKCLCTLHAQMQHICHLERMLCVSYSQVHSRLLGFVV